MLARGKCTKQGFSLLEMAIVLLVVGLIAAAVLLGKHLVRASELRAVVSEISAIQKAIGLFIEKYRALPGDMTNAETLWGTDPGGCPATPTNTVPKVATCNGTGDGLIANYNVDAGLANDSVEAFRVWQHLSNAELIDGKFTGAKGSGGDWHAVIGTNVPRSKFKGGGYFLLHYINTAGDAEDYPGYHHHVLMFGAALAGVHNIGAVLLPEEAREMDLKMDDGRPGLGTLRQRKPAPGTINRYCTTTTNPNTAEYQLTYNFAACSPQILMDF